MPTPSGGMGRLSSRDARAVGRRRGGQVSLIGNDVQTYSAQNVTTDRAYDANSTSLAELADVLGTLINDLRSQGLVV
jgi:hypothetical protein